MKSKISLYKDQIVKNLCDSLEKNSDDWSPIKDNLTHLTKYLRKDGIIVSWNCSIFPIEIYLSDNQYNYTITDEQERIMNSINKMIENKKILAENNFLKKMNVATRKEKLQNISKKL